MIPSDPWVAGILEGEGCFYITERMTKKKDGRTYGPYIQVQIVLSMVDEDVVETVAEYLGVGNLVWVKERATTRQQKQRRWQVYNKNSVIEVMERVRPYMGARRGAKIDEMMEKLNATPHD